MNVYLGLLVYVSAIVLANLSAATFGPTVTPVNAFILIGLDLALRNWLALKVTPLRMLGLIGASAAASYLLNPASGAIAVASLVAFTAAALVDWLTFGTLSGRWLRRCIGGVTAGALVDSVLFPTIAFGTLLPWIVLAQFAAKVCGGTLWALALSRLQRRETV